LVSGHRIKTRVGHHQLTFEAAGVALGKKAATLVGYFDLCRQQNYPELL